MADLQEFRLTFGVRYAHEEHSTFPVAQPDGYVAVLAPDYETARDLVIARIGREWAFLYGPGELAERYTPAGELDRWSTAEGSHP